jgi:aspartate/methionine/tyrosine aminotransferase
VSNPESADGSISPASDEVDRGPDLRRVPRATYLQWAKLRPHPALDLARSDVPALSLDELPGARAALELGGRNDTGYPPLVSAIASRYGVREDQVATANGASGANFLACAALLRPGDEVLVETPGYDPLIAAPALLGARLVRFERRFEDGFRLDVEGIANAITPGTRLIIVTNPHNPTGVTSSTAEILELGKLAARHGAYVLVDEIYLDVATGSTCAVAATLGGPFITTSSLTKAYGLSQLRCGWALAAPEVAEQIRRTRDLVDGIGSILAERASVVAFEHLDTLAARARAILEPNLSRLTSFMASRPALDWVRPGGGTVAFPRLRSGEDARAFADRLLAHHQTMVVPGAFFEAPSHFRIGFGIAAETLDRGLAAIGRALEDS